MPLRSLVVAMTSLRGVRRGPAIRANATAGTCGGAPGTMRGSQNLSSVRCRIMRAAISRSERSRASSRSVIPSSSSWTW